MRSTFLHRLGSMRSAALGWVICASHTLRRFFDTFSELDYARGGAVVDQDVVIEPEAFAEFAMTFTMLEPLKKLGLNVQLKHGVLALEDPFTVCSAGDVLTPDQARLLVREACIV